MPAECANPSHSRRAIIHLQAQIDAALMWDESLMVPLTKREISMFKRDHPGADFVIGDFEIKCLNPEKYNL